MDNPQPVLDRLADLMNEERLAISSGDFSGLGALAETKRMLIDQVSGELPEHLEAVRSAAAENQRILRAALMGVRAARRQMEAILQARNGFNSYDLHGSVRGIGAEAASVEKRA